MNPGNQRVSDIEGNVLLATHKRRNGIDLERYAGEWYVSYETPSNCPFEKLVGAKNALIESYI